MSKSITKLLALMLLAAISFSVAAQDKEESAPKPASKSSSNEEKPKPSFDLGGEEVDETQTDPASEYSTADLPEDNYLAKFHALDKITYFEKKNLEQIFMLNVIKENFKDKFKSVELEEEYDKVYKGYKKAMDLYYRREPIYASVKLEENNKHINQLYEKISDQYKEDTLKLLNLCADNILILSLQASSASNPNSNKKLFNQMNRLRVAYGQLDDAEEARVKRHYQTSVLHYRVAKSYAIQILEDIDPTTYIGKDDYKKQLDVHKADNKNRIFSGETTATEVNDKQKDLEKENQDNTQPESY